MKNILQMAELAAERTPDKTAFVDEKKSISYLELVESAKRIGSFLYAQLGKGRPVAIFLDKSVEAITAMLGIVYSGNIYTVIDIQMPPERIKKIFATLDPAAVISDEKHAQTARSLCEKTFILNEICKSVIDEASLDLIRGEQTDADPLYILYTSGSTGMPKGTVITHRNVLSYSQWFVDTFGVDGTAVIGNQTPLYFSMSVTDVYGTLRAGAELILLPKKCFSFPITLADTLNRYRVNLIYWVPSAYGIAANSGLFEIEKPKYLKKALFAGEVMPAKTLGYWMRHFGEDVLFANLFGPTETTDICTYYVVPRNAEIPVSLPIGRHCDNCGVFILNSEGLEAAPGEEGELYVRGTFVSPGYYNDPEKTAQFFVQNPLRPAYPEICYKTGDIVRINPEGELLYLGRKDHQIKRRGYRIELGEIENVAQTVGDVRECACTYDAEAESIHLFYTADKTEEKELLAELTKKMNRYLLPDQIHKLPVLPRNANGKIDRKNLERSL
ncbi:MAG: amino acid adenylation domain-containing protein [Clostridiales bacterium]|nr:amino acid adenylation domain-containing protein [Clostridiales bacterium]